MEMEDIEIQVWTEEQKKSRWEELLDAWFNFCKYEPMNAAITHLLDEGPNKTSLGLVLRDMMQFDDTPLIVAWDKVNKRVAGWLYAVSEHVGKTEESDEALYSFSRYDFDPDTLHGLKTMIKFLVDLAKKADILNKFGVDKLVAIQVTTVCPEYKKRGIANTMTAKFLEVAKGLGFSVVRAESTSAYTQHNKIKTFQFEKVLEVAYADGYATFSDMPEDIKDSHKTATILVKKI
ncbi:uncharacterized protein [Watersipora subatra]